MNYDLRYFPEFFTMKTPVRFSFLRAPVLALLLLAAIPGASHALMELEYVTPARAKELGMTVRVTNPGPGAVRVEIEFEKKGDLAKYERTDLSVETGDGKTLIWAPLKEYKIEGDRVVVGLSVDTAIFDKTTIRVVTGEATRVAHDVRLRDFPDLLKGKAEGK
jgi:hypothetical protein